MIMNTNLIKIKKRLIELKESCDDEVWKKWLTLWEKNKISEKHTLKALRSVCRWSLNVCASSPWAAIFSIEIAALTFDVYDYIRKKQW